MNISLDLLQTFVLYVETSSVVETAEQLGMSQPAVSAHLKRLEELLPLPPLVTRGRGKAVTTYGKSLYESIKGSLKDIDQGIERTNQQFVSPDQLSLRVGVRRELLARIAQTLEFPGQLIFSNLSTQDAIRELHDHNIDVAITTASPDSSHIVAKNLFSEGVKLIVPKRWQSHRTRLKDFRDPVFATETPILTYRRDPPFVTEWCTYCGIRFNQLKISVICEDWFAIVSMVTGGRGYSIVPANIPVPSSEVIEVAIPNDIIAASKIFVLYHKAFLKVPPISHLKLRSVV